MYATDLQPTLASGPCPIAQQKRRIGEDKRGVVKEEMSKPYKEKFIREVKYPKFLANHALVKIAKRQRRMCIDYTDLNKVCLNDPCPLPRFDRLSVNKSGFGLLRFMDVYLRYNQMLRSEDEEKMTFITDRSNFCYKVMSFNLKSVRAPYQHLMNSIFVISLRR